MVQRLRSLYLSAIMEERKGRFPSLVLSLLSPISHLYHAVLKLRELLYRFGVLSSISLPTPVISIGNITMGGTGKTPFVEFLAKFLLDRGKKVVILSRGYAGMKIGGERVNDEYLELLERLPDVPVFLGGDRASRAMEALKSHSPDCFLLDDGFQHWRLARDLDIVLIDGLKPFGNEGLIPAGPLREPLHNLSRAGLFVLSHTDLCRPAEIQTIKRRLSEITPGVPILEASHHPLYLEDTAGHRLEIPWLKDKRLYAFCGLGNPGSFQKTLQRIGADVVRFKGFPDHYHYSTDELATIDAEASGLGVDAIVTTQKDFTKLKRVANNTAWQNPIFYLRIEMRITKGLDLLTKKLEEIME